MVHRISATQLARSLGDVLARVRYRHDEFVVERNGEPVARLVPEAGASVTTVREALGAWREAGGTDPTFADDLELVGMLDAPADDPWAS